MPTKVHNMSLLHYFCHNIMVFMLFYMTSFHVHNYGVAGLYQVGGQTLEIIKRKRKYLSFVKEYNLQPANFIKWHFLSNIVEANRGNNVRDGL